MADLKHSASHQSDIPSEPPSDIEKRVGNQHRHEPGLDAIHEEDAVGYKEYREGLDLEITPKDVSHNRSCILRTFHD